MDGLCQSSNHFSPAGNGMPITNATGEIPRIVIAIQFCGPCARPVYSPPFAILITRQLNQVIQTSSLFSMLDSLKSELAT
jgi:hypothetical protein